MLKWITVNLFNNNIRLLGRSQRYILIRSSLLWRPLNRKKAKNADGISSSPMKAKLAANKNREVLSLASRYESKSATSPASAADPAMLQKMTVASKLRLNCPTDSQ